MWGEELARDMLEAAGFKAVDIKRLAHDFQNSYFICRKSPVLPSTPEIGISDKALKPKEKPDSPTPTDAIKRCLNYICYMISQGFDQSDTREYHGLIDSPEYRCDRCDRQAQSDANLCMPIKL